MWRFIQSTKYAVNGILYGLRTERNLQIWFGIFVITYLVSFWLRISYTEWFVVILWTFIIGISEFINTSIEVLADRVTLERDEKIKRVKDVAAGATFLASTGSFITGLIIFIPKIIEKFGFHF